MELQIAWVALTLFAIMFLPLPAPVGLAAVLWALQMDVPFPVVLALYVLQDALTYLAVTRLVPWVGRRLPAGVRAAAGSMPAPLRRVTRRLLRPTSLSDGGLISAALLSFYAGAALAALRPTGMLRAALLVIGADLLKWANGVALAVGVLRLLPASPFTTLAASLIALAAVPVIQKLSASRRQLPQVARVDWR